MLFELIELLCVRYPALSPFEIRARPADDFFIIVRQVLVTSVLAAKPSLPLVSALPGRTRVTAKTASGGWY